jgi:hypothetical protein
MEYNTLDYWGFFTLSTVRKLHAVATLQPPSHAGSSLADFSTLKIVAILFSETSVHTRSTQHHFLEYGIL